jgi:hypothetical protein
MAKNKPMAKSKPLAVLHGSIWVDPKLLKSAAIENNTQRVYMDEVPDVMWATEADIDISLGARENSWTRHRLEWRGCHRAMGFRDNTFYRCGFQADETGFCKGHQAGARKDGRIAE